MDRVKCLKCSICGEEYPPNTSHYVCPRHGDDGNLNVVYDLEKVRQYVDEKGFGNTFKEGTSSSIGHWVYRAFLPLSDTAKIPPLVVGNTPLYEAPDLATQIGVKRLMIKDDGRNPTASLKDRASSLLVAKSVDDKRAIITTASTGNAAAALSGLSASLGASAVIFVPASAPEAKIAQMLVYGATVFLVEGTYDDAFALCLAASKKYGWYCRNTGYNPYTAEGKKTVAFEICEQIATANRQAAASGTQFDIPDAIVVSVGDGNIITGVHKGLKNLFDLKLIPKIPKLIGAQAVGSNFCYDAWVNNQDPVTKPAIKDSTVADSISAGLPRDRLNAVNAVKETGGAFVAVEDEEILAAIPELARATGVFAEPAAAAAYAGLKAAVKQGLLTQEDQVCVVVTGNGLKDVVSARKSLETTTSSAVKVKNSEESVDEAVKKLSL